MEIQSCQMFEKQIGKVSSCKFCFYLFLLSWYYIKLNKLDAVTK